MIRTFVERRSKARRGVYLACAVVAFLVGLFGIGMEGDLRVTIPYLLIIAICIIQFFRPTLLGWFVLTALFSAYAFAVAMRFQPPVHEFAMSLLIGVLPALALLWSWPKRVTQ